MENIGADDGDEYFCRIVGVGYCCRISLTNIIVVEC